MRNAIPSRRALLGGAGALAIGASVPVAAIAATSPDAEYEALTAALRRMLEQSAQISGDDCPHLAAYFQTLKSVILDAEPVTLLCALVRYHCGLGSPHPDDANAEWRDDGNSEDFLAADLWRMAEASEPARAAELRGLLFALYAPPKREAVG